MRVKLSYTVKEENVLKEVAKIINLSTEDMQEAVTLFSAVQRELEGSDENMPNIQKAAQMIDNFRAALVAVDTRLMEVAEIIVGYEEYQFSKKAEPDSDSSSTMDNPPPDPELFGAE
tara:strand:- start:1024 stop:1374 length:351 start_codon:yes stop_codon:yes gene_type:complete